MASVPAVALRRTMWGLAVVLVPLMSGCVGLPMHHLSGPVIPAKVSQVLVAWQNNVAMSPDPLNGGRSQPVLAGRMYLFGAKIDYPLLAQGGFKVELFDDTNGIPAERPLEEWAFRAEDMPHLMKKDFLGVGYSVLLPWGTYRPDIVKLRLRTSYTPPDDLPVYTENLVTLDTSNGIIRDVSSNHPPLSLRR